MQKEDSKKIKEMQNAMKKKEDYMSMPLPRSFANTASMILRDYKKSTNPRTHEFK